MASIPAIASATPQRAVRLERAVREVAVEADGDAEPAADVEDRGDHHVRPAQEAEDRGKGDGGQQRDQRGEHEDVHADLLRQPPAAVQDRSRTGGLGSVSGQGHRVSHLTGHSNGSARRTCHRGVRCPSLPGSALSG
jgi:hypothetical protein